MDIWGKVEAVAADDSEGFDFEPKTEKDLQAILVLTERPQVPTPCITPWLTLLADSS